MPSATSDAAAPNVYRVRYSQNESQGPFPRHVVHATLEGAPQLSAKALPGLSFWLFQISTCRHFSVCFLWC